MPTIIASWGASNANSYVTLSEANVYMATKINYDAWSTAENSKKEASLIEATRQIDARRWRGTRYYYDQRLEFPRTMYEDDPAYPGEMYALTTIGSPSNVEWNKMIERVKSACCEQALHLLDLGGNDPIGKLRRRGVSSYSESIGKISESYSFGSGSSVLSPETMHVLSYYRSTPRLVRS